MEVFGEFLILDFRFTIKGHLRPGGRLTDLNFVFFAKKGGFLTKSGLITVKNGLKVGR